MRLAILMPSFNERAATVEKTLAGLREVAPALGGVAVYLVDDGSEAPLSIDALPAATPEFQVVVARHLVNLGQGAALETARQLAVREDHEVFITMDVDGQHLATDLAALVGAVDAGNDVVFGNRFASDSNVPTMRRLVLTAARTFEMAITGLKLSDAHNGFRAFSRVGIEALSLRQNRMAHATEIKQQVAKRRAALKITEVPVSIRYSAETLQKGQSSLGAIAILKDLANHFLFGPET